jgi:hypothetical protein
VQRTVASRDTPITDPARSDERLAIQKKHGGYTGRRVPLNRYGWRESCMTDLAFKEASDIANRIP